MLPIYDFRGIEMIETQRAFGRASLPPARLVGLVFCRPESSLAQSQIIPALPYFHARSGHNVAFYFGGYLTSNEEFDRQALVPVRGPEGRQWYFHAALFDSFRRDVEARTRWRYSGECDMILADVRYTYYQDAKSFPQAHLNFTSCMAVRLDKLQELAPAPSVSAFFEKVFQYAENQHPNNPTWGFSDWLGAGVAASGLKNLFLSILPSSLQSDARAAFNVVVRDISVRP